MFRCHGADRSDDSSPQAPRRRLLGGRLRDLLLDGREEADRSVEPPDSRAATPSDTLALALTSSTNSTASSREGKSSGCSSQDPKSRAAMRSQKSSFCASDSTVEDSAASD